MEFPYLRRLHKIAFIGNFLPRRCGIATFTTDLVRAIKNQAKEINCAVLAMNDIPGGYNYPEEVCFEIYQKNLSDYRLAADFLNMNQMDVVCLQHEYGIFGGESGSYIIELLQNLRMPIVSTLHTIIREPQPLQKTVLQRICSLSDKVVVMSYKAQEILQEVYAVPAEKIVFIPHGIPDVTFIDPNYYKDQFGAEGKKVILTFGLISPGKGIEYMINALPEIVKKHPDTVYIILGATHPHVQREQGESYRLFLQRLAREKKVDKHIIFHNRFVELSELCEFLGAADIYVTPYLNREQIVSGTLAYALGAGKATISSPYWYAEEMLAENRGRLVPFRDSRALAEQVIDLLDNETERHLMRKRAYNFCRNMIWKEVGRQYLATFDAVIENRMKSPRAIFQTKTMDSLPPEIPELNIDHLLRLSDDIGILQHAKFIIPDRSHGYSTDDNARALIAVLLANKYFTDDPRLTDLACRYLSLLDHSFNQETGRFRNFLGYDRRWREINGSDDSHGRAVMALGATIALAEINNIAAMALNLFNRAVYSTVEFTSPRAWAFTLISIDYYLKKFPGASEMRRLQETLAKKLYGLYLQNAGPDWQWIENILTYDNGCIPQALISAGQWLKT